MNRWLMFKDKATKWKAKNKGMIVYQSYPYRLSNNYRLQSVFLVHF